VGTGFRNEMCGKGLEYFWIEILGKSPVVRPGFSEHNSLNLDQFKVKLCPGFKETERPLGVQ